MGWRVSEVYNIKRATVGDEKQTLQFKQNLVK